jgi:hypothetical protein
MTDGSFAAGRVAMEGDEDSCPAKIDCAAA